MNVICEIVDIAALAQKHRQPAPERIEIGRPDQRHRGRTPQLLLYQLDGL